MQATPVAEGVVSSWEMEFDRCLCVQVLEAISDMLEDKLPPKAMIMHVMTLPLGPEEGASSKL